MKRLLLVLTALAASSGVAQETSKPQDVQQTLQALESLRNSRRTQRIVEVKHVSPNRIANLLTIFGIEVKADANLKIISLSGPTENVKAAEEAIHRLDVPPPSRNIESTFYMLMALQKGDADGKLPAELGNVIKQLKTVSAYQSYRLLDTIVLRSREGGRSETSGALPVPAQVPGGPPPGSYSLIINDISIDPDSKADHLAHLTDIRFTAKMPVSNGPNNWQFRDNHILTSVDVREGQKIVIGKANVDGGESALILVVTVNVIE